MLVKRAQDLDESEMIWRGKHATGEADDQDLDDPRTDNEMLDKLKGVPIALLAATSDLDKWTSIAASEDLPDPRPDEDTVLAPGYDAKKAEEEEKKNQAEAARFSGGGELLTFAIVHYFSRPDGSLYCVH